jgi:hypothetical protein
MAVDPATIIGEILGEPAAQMRNPANAEYQCPFINSTCTKKGHAFVPYPVCSVWASTRNPNLVCACPVRFYQTNFVQDIVENCWPGPAPRNLKISYEVKMAKFGKVDVVLADIDPRTGQVLQFVSVELQAVDFTGSVELAYSALINSTELQIRPKNDPNWANVRKRLISQIIVKGFYHHHWQTRMVVVLQTALYNRIRIDVPFKESPAIDDSANVVFALYDYKVTPDGQYSLELDRIVGTSHSDVMMAPLYQQVPSKDEFCKKILSQLR